MTREEAIYFLEGFTAGLAAPTKEMAKSLFMLVTFEFGLTFCELNEIRAEIDQYLDIAEVAEEDEEIGQ